MAKQFLKLAAGAALSLLVVFTALEVYADTDKLINSSQDERIDCTQWQKLANSAPVKPAAMPVYPDIWSFVPDKDEWITSTVLLPDGDIGLGLLNQATKRERKTRLFFDKPLSHEDQCRIKYAVGTASEEPTQSTLNNGRYVSRLGAGYTWDNGCHWAGLGNQIVIYGDTTEKEVVAKRTLLYIVNKPIGFVPRADCENTESFDILVSAYDRFLHIPLPDGTFVSVANDEISLFSPILIRLDQQLKTRSPLINKNLFIVDINELFHGIYGDKDISKISSQHLQKDIYNHLMAIKQGRVQP